MICCDLHHLSLIMNIDVLEMQQIESSFPENCSKKLKAAICSPPQTAQQQQTLQPIRSAADHRGWVSTVPPGG